MTEYSVSKTWLNSQTKQRELQRYLYSEENDKILLAKRNKHNCCIQRQLPLILHEPLKTNAVTTRCRLYKSFQVLRQVSSLAKHPNLLCLHNIMDENVPIRFIFVKKWQFGQFALSVLTFWLCVKLRRFLLFLLRVSGFLNKDGSDKWKILNESSQKN